LKNVRSLWACNFDVANFVVYKMPGHPIDIEYTWKKKGKHNSTENVVFIKCNLQVFPWVLLCWNTVWAFDKDCTGHHFENPKIVEGC